MEFVLSAPLLVMLTSGKEKEMLLMVASIGIKAALWFDIADVNSGG